MIAALLLAAAAVTPVPAGTAVGRALPVRVVGRTVRVEGGWLRQWPGTYFEGAFRGRTALLRVGSGDVTLHVLVDGARVATLSKPAPGLYRLSGLAAGRHVLRVAVASESQSTPTVFGGLFATPASTPLPPPPAPRRRIEFIGDSHTVGYGNTAGTRDCDTDRVWATTDTVRGIAGQLADSYHADYRVNAISGRGVVRNYDGFAGDTVPQAYPYARFDRTAKADDAGWSPDLIVIALGTNDFSTALKPGERWASRDALRADYERGYAGFVRALRAAHPRAHVLLWATDIGDGEVARAEARVAATLAASGMRDVGFVRVPPLAFGGCHFHPSVADDTLIAGAIRRYVDAHPRIWRRKAAPPTRPKRA
jgi:lysophospholipase L1-like esterase